MKITHILSLVSAVFVFGLTQAAFADPHCARCPYYCSDLGLGHRDCSELPSSRGLCCLDLTEKGLRLALEQERALAADDDSGSSYNRGRGSQERCPAGFSPSEQKCSQQERRNGCKDMRLSNGLGCVHR